MFKSIFGLFLMVCSSFSYGKSYKIIDAQALSTSKIKVLINTSKGEGYLTLNLLGVKNVLSCQQENSCQSIEKWIDSSAAFALVDFSSHKGEVFGEIVVGNESLSLKIIRNGLARVDTSRVRSAAYILAEKKAMCMLNGYWLSKSDEQKLIASCQSY